jgi:tetratricopeptide (TPR) repeat protein
MPRLRVKRVELEAALIAVALFAVYAFGACRTIYVGDSGELVAAVHTLGIPHPSGYPLYVLLGKLWTLLVPLGSVAYRMSLFSAAAAALACGALYVVCRRMALGVPSSLFAALLLAFGASFWSQANIQRVYSLDALFVVLATGAAFEWHRTRETRPLVLAFFLAGLGASNHTFMAIYALALGLFMLATEPRLLVQPAAALRRFVIIFTPFLVGLLPYAYLVIRSRMNPRLDWGDPETLHRFLAVVFREGFWQRAWIEGPGDLIQITSNYVLGLGDELAWAGTALAVVGVIAGFSRGWPVLLPLLVMLGNLLALAFHGSRSDIFLWHRYYIPSYAMGALLAGMGCRVLAERARGIGRWGPLVIPLLLLVLGWRHFDRSRYRIADDFAHAVLESVPPGANLIATDDNVLFVLIYLQLVENERPDVNLIMQGVGDADLPPLKFNPDTDPLFFTHHPNWDLPTLEIVARGVVYQAWRRGEPKPPLILPREELAGENDPRVPKDYLTRNLIGHFHYTMGFSFEDTDWLRARREFEKAAAIAAENDVLFFNLGLVYGRNGLYDDAIAAFDRSHEINPRHLASLSKPRADERAAEWRAERDRVHRIEERLTAEAGDLPPQGSAAWHLRMADLLAAAGEPTAARGHALRALELSHDEPSPTAADGDAR